MIIPRSPSPHDTEITVTLAELQATSPKLANKVRRLMGWAKLSNRPGASVTAIKDEKPKSSPARTARRTPTE